MWLTFPSLPSLLRRLLPVLFLAGTLLPAQENYFVTYSHQMEEPGNLELGTKSVAGAPRGGNPFLGAALELEYGV